MTMPAVQQLPGETLHRLIVAGICGADGAALAVDFRERGTAVYSTHRDGSGIDHSGPERRHAHTMGEYADSEARPKLQIEVPENRN